jgi:predicted DNA-binding transcriptional regulator AlpA
MESSALEPLFTSRDVAELTGVSLATLRRQREAGLGPRYCLVSKRSIRYPRNAVFTWLKSIESTVTENNA